MLGSGLKPKFFALEWSQGKELGAGWTEACRGHSVVLSGLVVLETELVGSAPWIEMQARAHDFVLPSGDGHAT